MPTPLTHPPAAPPPAFPAPAAGLARVHVTVLDMPGEISTAAVKARLTAFLKGLRAASAEARLEELRTDGTKALALLERYGSEGDGPPDRDIHAWLEDRVRGGAVTGPDRARIARRAEAFAARHNAAAADAAARLDGLSGNEGRSSRLRERVLRLAGPVPATAVADGAQADVIAAGLHAEMPWMGPATEACWRALLRSARTGSPFRLGPLLLDGPPGIGKTSWAHRLAARLGIPSVEIDASKGLASFSLAGTERGWASSQPGRPLEAMMDGRIANPLVIVDELDKASSLGIRGGASAAFQPALLGLVEPETARAWDCPFHRLRFDMSHLSWVLTSNDIRGVAGPVRSRMQVLSIPYPTVAELRDFAGRRAAETGLSGPAAEALVEAVGRAAARWQLDLRMVSRMVRRAEDWDSGPTVH